MKSLQTLLKVAQRRMDELGLEAVKARQEIEAVRASQAALKAREDNEIKLAASDVALAWLLPAYRQRVKWRQDQIGAEMAKLEARLAEVQALLTKAYQEKSKFELLLEQEAIRKAAEGASKELAQLDEVAINRAGTNGT